MFLSRRLYSSLPIIARALPAGHFPCNRPDRAIYLRCGDRDQNARQFSRLLAQRLEPLRLACHCCCPSSFSSPSFPSLSNLFSSSLSRVSAPFVLSHSTASVFVRKPCNGDCWKILPGSRQSSHSGSLQRAHALALESCGGYGAGAKLEILEGEGGEGDSGR